MKKLLALLTIVLVFCSAFSVLPTQVEAKGGNPSSLWGLYAGSTNPGEVWEYKGGTSWESITDQPSELGWSVTSIVEFEGKLYAATISDPNVYSSFGRVYRYDGKKTWTPIVSGLEANQVTFLVVYGGELYAGTYPARLYKYDSATTSWSMVLEYGTWSGFRSAYVWNDWLYLGEWYWDRFARWDGTTFDEFYPYHTGSCIYSIEQFGDYLYGAAYSGNIYRVAFEPPSAAAIWCPPQWHWAWALKTFKDHLYIGLDARYTGVAPLYRYDGSNPPSQTWTYSTTTGNPYEGIISMATDGGYLYVGLGGQAVGYPSYMSAEGTGKVYKSSDGVNFEPASATMGTGIQTLYYVPLEYNVTAYAYPEEADDYYFPDSSTRVPIRIVRMDGSIVTVSAKRDFVAAMRLNGGGLVNDNPQGYEHVVQGEWNGHTMTGRWKEVDEVVGSKGWVISPYKTIAKHDSDRQLKYRDTGYFIVEETGERYEYSVDDRLAALNHPPRQIDFYLGIGQEAYHTARLDWGVKKALLYIPIR